jgi:SulP family sulfate permease
VVLRKCDLRETRSKRRRPGEELLVLSEHGDEAVVVQLQGNLFFGTTDQLFSELEADLRTRRYILLDLRRVQSMDFTAGHLFEQMDGRLRGRGGELLFSGMPSSMPTRQDIEKYMGQLGIVREGGGIRVFAMRDAALEWMEDRILENAGWTARPSDPPLKLGQFELFRDFGEETLATLGLTVRDMKVAAGGTIFARGDMGDEIFLVRRGRVQITLPLEAGKKHHLATFCRGEFFGEIAFLDRGQRSANAEAATDTELYVLSRKQFDAVTSSNAVLSSDVFEQLAFAISQRLRTANTEVRALEER